MWAPPRLCGPNQPVVMTDLQGAADSGQRSTGLGRARGVPRLKSTWKPTTLVLQTANLPGWEHGHFLSIWHPGREAARRKEGHRTPGLRGPSLSLQH